MNKTLTIREQIKVINEAINNYEKYLKLKNYNSKYIKAGLCYYISSALEDIVDSCVYYEHIINYIPLFNKENAIRASSNKFKYLSKSDYWWDIDNHEARLFFCQWMIEQLKKQL